MASDISGNVGSVIAATQLRVDVAPQVRPDNVQMADVLSDSANSVAASVKPVDKADFDQRVVDASRGMNEFFDSIDKDIRFHIDEESDRIVVSVIEASSGEVVRQIPSEEVLELAARMSEASGLLMNDKV